MINQKRFLKLVTSTLVIGFLGGILLNRINDYTTKVDLPPEKVISKLNEIPVFAIWEKQNAVVKRVFISQSEAKRYVKRFNSNIESSSKVEVFPAGLGNIYKLEIIKQNKNHINNFDYVPEKKAINLAKTILEDEGQEYKNGIPLFVIREKDNKSYLSIVTNSFSIIPVFFEKEQLYNFLVEIEKQHLDLTDNLDVEVVFLDELIKLLETKDNSFSEKLTLIPSKETQIFMDQTDFSI